jgi:hypothetical protein
VTRAHQRPDQREARRESNRMTCTGQAERPALCRCTPIAGAHTAGACRDERHRKPFSSVVGDSRTTLHCAGAQRSFYDVPSASDASPVDLTKHNVLRSDERNDVCEHVSLGHHVQRCQVGEPRGSDLAAVRLVRSVGDKVDTKLSLGRLDRCVRRTSRNRVPVCRGGGGGVKK